jgi:hypothetical protein
MTPQSRRRVKGELDGERHLTHIAEQLKKAFASVVAEPLPPAMLDLLDALDHKPAGSDTLRRLPNSE